MIGFRKENDEVLYPTDGVFLDCNDLVELKRLASLNPRQRVRFCAHRSPDDRLHEMFIVHTRDCYVRPHRHLGKAESISILEGEVDLVLFNADGTVLRVLAMGSPQSGRTFFHRLSEPVFHTLLIRSEYLVFHEITEGPFVRTQTEFPVWAPQDNTGEAATFIANLNRQLSHRGST